MSILNENKNISIYVKQIASIKTEKLNARTND